jgi:uncharacterized membrane protein YhiD involved in acid resistance
MWVSSFLTMAIGMAIGTKFYLLAIVATVVISSDHRADDALRLVCPRNGKPNSAGTNPQRSHLRHALRQRLSSNIPARLS